jgi:Uma2 family endonuclease
MTTQSFDLIEDFQSEDTMSVIHSRLIQRLCVALDKYQPDFDILPELELELPTGKCKPDVCIYPKLPADWFNDITFYKNPPLTAIEIQSPRQATSDLTDKMNTVYFPAGVKSVWIIVPMLQIIQIRTPAGGVNTFTDGVVTDTATRIDVLFAQIFR